MTSTGSGSRPAVRSVSRRARPKLVRSTAAPSSWASLATWKAIESLVRTPVISSRLPARITGRSPENAVPLTRPCERVQCGGQAPARIGRLDDLIDETGSRSGVGSEVLLGVGIGQPGALLLRITGHAKLAPVHDADGRAGAHDPQLGVGPSQHQIAAEIA